MTKSIAPASKLRQLSMFGIVAVLASAAIAILVATDVANPYFNLKTTYLICAVVGCVGLIQLVYSIAMVRQS